VVFTKKKDAKDAIESMDGHSIKGKVIGVTFVDEEEEEEQPPGTISVLVPSAPTSSAPPSICILVNNMFDTTSEEAKSDQNYFKDIWDNVLDLCEEVGIVDIVWVDEDSPGNVWIKFSLDSIEGSVKA